MWMEENGLTWVCGIELWIGEFIEWVCGIEFGTKALNKWALMLLGEWSFVESIRKRSNLEQCLQTNAMPMRSESVWTLLSNLQKRTESERIKRTKITVPSNWDLTWVLIVYQNG